MEQKFFREEEAAGAGRSSRSRRSRRIERDKESGIKRGWGRGSGNWIKIGRHIGRMHVRGTRRGRKIEEERKGVIYCRGDERGGGMIIFREGVLEFICEHLALEKWGDSR